MKSQDTPIPGTLSLCNQNTSRGQTAIGSQFGILIVILMFLGVLSIGYTYTATPAFGASSSVTESAALANYLVSSELAPNAQTTATAGGPQLSPSETKKFFISGNTSGVTDHWVTTSTSNINWNVTVDAQNQTTSTTLLGKERLEAGTSAPFYASEYERPAMLNGDVVIVRVRTWQ